MKLNDSPPLAMKACILSFACLLFLITVSFRANELLPETPKAKLSDYAFFEGPLSLQQPAKGVIAYALNTPLFSDYAEKLRFIQFPTGQSVVYNNREVLDFPVGTVIIKTFYFLTDFRKPQAGRRLMETRLLLHEPTGWKALEYVWNEEQTEAYLEVAGNEQQVNYTDASGKKRKQTYVIPNLNQCKGCHNRNEVLTPIGPSARQLNGELQYPNNERENQLDHWQKLGILKGMPALANCPKAPVWNDPSTGSVSERARIWLDINCGHCHRPEGPASTSGLNLSIHEQDLTAIGLQKTPVAAGRGSGGRLFDIVPGQPDASILLYRIESTDPSVMMPEVGRKVVHKEGAALMREWIKSLK